MNLPDLLTVFRILASFLYLYYGLRNEWGTAFPIFCVAAFSDMIDGTIARVFHQRTRLGAFLDPAADKLLTLFGFMTLTWAGYLPWPLTALVVFRDLLITTGLAVLKMKRIEIPFRPTILSKFTTLFQIVTVLAALISTQPLSEIRQTFYGRFLGEEISYLIAVTAFLTLVTAVQYVLIGGRMLRRRS